MPLGLYKDLGFGSLNPTSTRLWKHDCAVKKSVGKLCNMLVNVDSFIFLVNFVILNCEVDFDILIILERTFIDVRWAFVDKEKEN